MGSRLTLDECFNLDPQTAKRLYSKHINPALMNIYRSLGLANMDVESAEGMEILLGDGTSVLDFSAAIGVVGLGHNHPRILAAERRCQDEKILDAIKVAPHKLQGALAHNLAAILPDPLSVCFFSVSGAEAVEAALKICEKAQGPKKTKFITTSNSFHGKTHGAMSITRSGGFHRGFLMGIPQENVIEVEYGSLASLRQAIESPPGSGPGNDIIAFIVEPIQGENLSEGAHGYLEAAVELCRGNNILTIFDEVKMGMGRTGHFCSFQAEDVVPDVVTLSKALGGGKRAIGAMVSTPELFERAYGSRQDCSLHTSTFSGLGSSCAVAIEALNVYFEEDLLDHARVQGEYLRSQLESLKDIHEGSILELRGRGLIQGIRFNFGRHRFDNMIDTSKMGVFKTVDSAFMASVIRDLFERHHILAHFAPSAPDILHIMPPLIVEKEHLDRFVDAIDDILQRGFIRTAGDFLKGNFKDLLGS